MLALCCGSNLPLALPLNKIPGCAKLPDSKLILLNEYPVSLTINLIDVSALHTAANQTVLTVDGVG